MLAIVTAGHGAAPELPRLRGVANIKCSPAFQTSNTSYSILFCNRREHFNMLQYHCHWEAYLHKCGWCCILPSPCRVTAQHSGHLWTAAAGAATSGVMSAHLSQSPGLSGHKTLVSGPGQSQESYGPVSNFDLWKLLGEVEIFVEAVTRGGKTRN